MSRAAKRLMAMTPQQFEVAAASPQTVAEQMVVSLVHNARNGSMDALKQLWERTEGRVPQAVEVDSGTQKEVHERVSDIATERINALARSAAGELSQDEDNVEVSSDGDRGSEADGGESQVAGGSA
jgi:hypothetical protein